MAAVVTSGLKVDVCIIGTGVTGLLSAHRLVLEGAAVLVLAGPVPERTDPVPGTAILSLGLDWPFSDRARPVQDARLAVQSQVSALQWAEDLCGELGPGCGFARSDGFLAAVHGGTLDQLRQERDAALEAGIEGVEVLEAWPPAARAAGPCLKVPGQARVRLAPFLGALADAVERRGGRLRPDLQAREVLPGRPLWIRAQGGVRVAADAVVLASPSSLDDLLEIHSMLATYRTCRIGALVPRGSLGRHVYADTLGHEAWVEDLPGRDHDLLVVSGESHRLGRGLDLEHHWRRLERWAERHFPLLAIRFRSSFLALESSDRLGIAGDNPWGPPGTFIATGGTASGMTGRMAAAQVVTDLVLDRPNTWARLYDPHRSPGVDGLAFPEEMRRISWRYPGWQGSSGIRGLPANRGAILREGDSIRAIYRDQSGVLRELSPQCPNLRLPVRWDAEGRCWDCPCHGSPRVFF